MKPINLYELVARLTIERDEARRELCAIEAGVLSQCSPELVKPWAMAIGRDWEYLYSENRGPK